MWFATSFSVFTAQREEKRHIVQEEKQGIPRAATQRVREFSHLFYRQTLLSPLKKESNQQSAELA